VVWSWAVAAAGGWWLVAGGRRHGPLLRVVEPSSSVFGLSAFGPELGLPSSPRGFPSP